MCPLCKGPRSYPWDECTSQCHPSHRGPRRITNTTALGAGAALRNPSERQACGAHARCSKGAHAYREIHLVYPTSSPDGPHPPTHARTESPASHSVGLNPKCHGSTLTPRARVPTPRNTLQCVRWDETRSQCLTVGLNASQTQPRTRCGLAMNCAGEPPGNAQACGAHARCSKGAHVYREVRLVNPTSSPDGRLCLLSY